MTFILDTNVLSEAFKPSPDPAVHRWMDDAPRDRIYTSAITKAELLVGLAQMPSGRRKLSLATAIWHFLAREMRNEILGFGSSDAEAYAEIIAIRRAIGRPIDQFDAQIAAIAKTRGYAVVTRNVRDFDNCGVEIINPWQIA